MIPIPMEKFSPEKETPIEYGPPASHSDYLIASIPLSIQVNENPTVMDIFFCLSPGVIVLVLLMLFIFWGLFKKFSKLNNVWFHLYSCAVDQDSKITESSNESTTRCLYLRSISMLYIMAVFWFMRYFTSFISTDMTVSIPEEVIDSFDDLYQAYLDRAPKMYPVILQGMNVESVLRDSNQESALKILEIIQTEHAQCVYPKNEGSLMIIMDRIYAKTAAFILDGVFLRGSQFMACMRTEDAHKFRSSRNTILPITRYHAYAKDLNPHLKEILNDMNFRLFESGLHQDQHDERSTYNNPYFEIAPPSARLCLYTFDEQKIIDTDPVKPFGLAYTAFAFYLFCAGVTLGAIAFTAQKNIFVRMCKREDHDCIEIKRKGKKTSIQVTNFDTKNERLMAPPKSHNSLLSVDSICD